MELHQHSKLCRRPPRTDRGQQRYSKTGRLIGQQADLPLPALVETSYGRDRIAAPEAEWQADQAPAFECQNRQLSHRYTRSTFAYLASIERHRFPGPEHRVRLNAMPYGSPPVVLNPRLALQRYRRAD